MLTTPVDSKDVRRLLRDLGASTDLAFLSEYQDAIYRLPIAPGGKRSLLTLGPKVEALVAVSMALAQMEGAAGAWAGSGHHLQRIREILTLLHMEGRLPNRPFLPAAPASVETVEDLIDLPGDRRSQRTMFNDLVTVLGETLAPHMQRDALRPRWLEPTHETHGEADDPQGSSESHDEPNEAAGS